MKRLLIWFIVVALLIVIQVGSLRSQHSNTNMYQTISADPKSLLHDFCCDIASTISVSKDFPFPTIEFDDSHQSWKTTRLHLETRNGSIAAIVTEMQDPIRYEIVATYRPTSCNAQSSSLCEIIKMKKGDIYQDIGFIARTQMDYNPLLVCKTNEEP